MSDYMLLEYLRNHPSMRKDEHELVDEFKDYMRAKNRRSMRGSRRHKDYFEDMEHDYYEWDRDFENIHRAKGYMRDAMHDDSIDEYEAKEIVSNMFHYDNNKRITGEYFTMKKAEEVIMKYKEHFASKATPEDVYIAINATYHDLCGLFKTWFGPNIDDKIILLAITFWFKDDDYQGNKIMDYFM